MLITRNSKKRQLIIETLKKDKTHPSINDIYKKVHKSDKELGVATVYRNVNKLETDGIIRKVATIDGVDRYDADLSSHYHLICSSCSRILDLFDEELIKSINKFKKRHDLQVIDYNLVFKGICTECRDWDI